MRLHRLEVTAFGPFAQRQEVDFDRLSEAGLFLLHGPTGAGKTSVLDAICFALYGRVPGVRGGAGRLRSDHAPADLAPEVVCDFTVSGRRFEVTRSPEWHRPKKRGTGTVREQAHVVLREWSGGQWIGLTNRIDEAADLLDQVIGLGAEQFTKLILLPQGDFAAFLRASAEERRPLLQKLFGTDRFAEVERWLADRRREFEHHIQAAGTTTARLFARAQEARLDLDPETLVDGVPEVEAAGALVLSWAEAARLELAAAQVEVSGLEQQYESARQAAEEGAELVRQHERQAELAAELAELRAAGPDQERRRAALAAASHAGVLAPLLAELDQAERQAASADQRWSAAQAEVIAGGGDPAGASAERVGELRAELGSLADLVGAEADLGRLDLRWAQEHELVAEAGRDQLDAEAGLASLTGRSGELAQARGAAELTAVTLTDREHDAARATTIAKAVLRAQQLGDEQAEADDALRAAIDVHQAAVGASQELRARRLDGMAAELAAGLAPGGECPVCGSAEHPAPAAHATAPVTEPAQRQAEAAETAALASREQAQQTVNAVAQQVAAVQAVTEGADAASASDGLIEAQRRVGEARAAAGEVVRLRAELLDVTAALELATGRRQAAVARAAAGREALAELEGRRADLRDRLDRGRGDDADVSIRYRRLELAADALARCLAAGQARDEAVERLGRAGAAAEAAARAAGFADRTAAGQAILSEAEQARQIAQLAEYDGQVARVRALLAERDAGAGESSTSDSHTDAAVFEPLQLDLFALQADPPVQALPDLELLRLAQRQARAGHELARERHTLAARAVRALSGLVAELDRHATATAPLRRQFAALDSVSRCVEGTGGDNALRMRLSSYVLAARLEQVAAAASIRLAAMSGGRYLLVHTDGPSRGGARSGLGLAVVDGWTGVQRDPASLSGGETFCTSLALALGLADVVQAEAGGSVIETLLVDEGFGSLDEQTLDEVMDVLDGLRSAGRSVGLVSHVGDLRDRIPAQLQVLKTRTGSQLVA